MLSEKGMYAVLYRQYFKKIQNILDEVLKNEYKNIEKAAGIISESIKKDGIIHVFGCSHAGILAEEMFYRAGGLVVISPIFGQELMLNVRPITRTTAVERLHGYAGILLEGHNIQPQDIMIVSSNSGRNPVAIEMAMEAKKRGLTVIAVTSMEFSKAVTSRHESGKRLFEVADLTLDNKGVLGDALMEADGFEGKFGPSSNIVGCTILHSVMVQAIENLVSEGINPPVFTSANIDGAEEKNRILMEKYKNRVSYL